MHDPKAYYRANKDKWKRYQRTFTFKRYGITEADYDRLLSEQGGVCAICGASDNLPFQHFAIDHEHATKAIRGLLCQACNRTIGLLGERPELLERAAAYLQKPTWTP